MTSDKRMERRKFIGLLASLPIIGALAPKAIEKKVWIGDAKPVRGVSVLAHKGQVIEFFYDHDQNPAEIASQIRELMDQGVLTGFPIVKEA